MVWDGWFAMGNLRETQVSPISQGKTNRSSPLSMLSHPGLDDPDRQGGALLWMETV